jgi:hypothetical protein
MIDPDPVQNQESEDKAMSHPHETSASPPISMLSAAALLAGLLGGCVTVEAPDKPIVIELNVNIRQEVIYRLAADAKNTVEENEDIF